MKSLRVRLTIAAVLVCVTVLSGVAWTLYRSVAAAVRDDFDRDLVADAELLAGLVEFDAADGVEAEVEPVIASFAERPDARTWSTVLREDGSILAGHDLSVFGAGPDADTKFAWVEIDGAPARILRMRFVPHLDLDPEETPPGWVPNPPTLELVMVRETERVDALLAGLRQAFWLLGLLAAVGVAVAIGWQVGRGVRPILLAGERLASLRVDDLRHRLDPNAVPTEVRPFIEQLNDLLARLERGVEREREFTGHVSHELRTPLTVVRVGIEIAARRHRDDPVLTERLRKVMTTVQEMAQLIDNLLLLSRLERGLISERQENIDLHAMVETVWDDVAASASARGLVFANEVPPGHVVHGCPTSMQTIVRNLLSNAAAYTEEGGQVRVRVLAGGAFEVWDSGPQLGDAQRSRVFDRFWRADEARTHATTHAGIGLSLVRELAAALRLSVSVENVAAGGLRFLVRPSPPVASTSSVERTAGERRPVWKRIAPAAGAVVVAAIAMAAAAAFVMRTSGDRVKGASARPLSQALFEVHEQSAADSDAVAPARLEAGPEMAGGGAALDEHEPIAEADDAASERPTDRRASAVPARTPREHDDAPAPNASSSGGRAPMPVAPSAIPGSSGRAPVGGAIPSTGGGPRSSGVAGSGGASPRSGSVAGIGDETRIDADDDECDGGDRHEGIEIERSVCLAYAELSPAVDNAWFPLPVGRVTVFAGEDDGDDIRIESMVLGDIERVGTAEALVVERLEYEDDELVRMVAGVLRAGARRHGVLARGTGRDLRERRGRGAGGLACRRGRGRRGHRHARRADHRDVARDGWNAGRGGQRRHRRAGRTILDAG